MTALSLPAQLDSAAIIHTVMKSPGISGAVTNVKFSADAVDFRVGSPGFGRDLHVDLAKGGVTQKEYELNVWGKIRTLHTFNGVDKNDERRKSTGL